MANYGILVLVESSIILSKLTIGTIKLVCKDKLDHWNILRII